MASPPSPNPFKKRPWRQGRFPSGLAEVLTHFVCIRADGSNSLLQFSLSAAERFSPVTDFVGIVDVDAIRILRVGDRRVFMGCIPPETPVGSLICCGSLCFHYYNFGLIEGQCLCLMMR